MVYVDADLEIFVLTYNRKKYLKECLESILAQTDQGIKVTVIDNHSTDGTKELLESYRAKGINHIINDHNLGVIGSMQKVQNISSTPWVMMFHDDDLIHPQYVEKARTFFNRSDTVMIVSYGKKAVNPTSHSFRKIKGVEYYSGLNSSEFTGELIKAKLIPFCSAIYRREFFKATEFRWDTYGKVGDRPFLLDVATCGETILFKKNMVLTRLHKFNDSRATDKSTTSNHWINLVQRIRKEAKRQKRKSGYLSFLLRGRKYLMMPLEPEIIKDEKRCKYLEKAYNAGAITKIEMITGIPYHYIYAVLRKINRYIVRLKLAREEIVGKI